MTYIGQSVRRFEDHRLLTGQGSFVDDIKLPGLQAIKVDLPDGVPSTL